MVFFSIRPCKPLQKLPGSSIGSKKPMVVFNFSYSSHRFRVYFVLLLVGMKRPNYKREANIECKLCHKFYKDELSLIGK